MPEPRNDGLPERLRRLPGQFLLALVNATAILVIVAAVLTIVAISRAEEVAANISATMTDAVLSRVDVEPQKLVAYLQGLDVEVRGLAEALSAVKEEGGGVLDPQLASLDERLGDLRASINALVGTRTILIEQALSEVGAALAAGLKNLKVCPTPSVPASTSNQESPDTTHSDTPAGD